MGTYDISRVAFDPKKHYTSVRIQQGRVLTDDDWNENERIENEDRRRSRIDIIGPYGSPDDGYKIENPIVTGAQFDFKIDAGIIYLGGLRLHHAMETYLLQKDWLEQPATEQAAPTAAVLNALASKTRSDLAYLEVWQQPICAVEDRELFEVALGKPDTTTRLRNMARVHVQQGIGDEGCSHAWTKLKTLWAGQNLGTVNNNYERVPDTLMVVSFPGNGLPDDLCSPQVAGGYLGAENQAIRVQLRKNKTFTWGFDDASPLYRVTAVTAADATGTLVTTISFVTPPKDSYHWPLSGQVVEILPWSAILSNGQKIAAREGHISQVNVPYVPNVQNLTLVTAIPAGFGGEWMTRSDNVDILGKTDNIYFYMKVWNRGTDITSLPEISVATGTAVPLGNTGLAVEFTGMDYIPGDYWVIASRPDTPNLVVPWSLQFGTGIPPMGIHRFFAPLGIIEWAIDPNNNQNVIGKVISDCRKHFKPLTDQECCCTFTVGDGIISQGDFNTIDEALANLPVDGGKICILPGIHLTNSIVTEKTDIEICGCGGDSLILPTVAGIANPIFQFISCQGIKLCSLSLASEAGIAIAITNDQSTSPTTGITIINNDIIAGICAIGIDTTGGPVGNNNIKILGNRIGMIDITGGYPAIFTIADDVLIEHNRIVVVPAPDLKIPGDNRNPQGPGATPFVPCKDPAGRYKNLLQWKTTLIGIYGFITKSVAGQVSSPAYVTQGGIQIGSTSERVRVIQNVIIGGAGNGITLGSLFDNANPIINAAAAYTALPEYSLKYTADTLKQDFNSTIYFIEIIENEINQMGLSGIGIPGIFDETEIGLIFNVEGLGIFGNIIVNCAQQTQDLFNSAAGTSLADVLTFGGITLASCGHTIIRDNLIKENGISFQYPNCGIFVRNAEEIEVAHNRILKNSATYFDPPLAGPRGGIVIHFAQQLLDITNTKTPDTPGFDGQPAAVISENIVEQPIGHSLFLIALGPVSVLGNQFLTRARDTNDPYSLLAGTVLIFNLGMSIDLLAVLLVLASTSYASLAANVNTPPADPATAELAFFDLVLLYLFFPDGRTMFANNQVTLDTRNQKSATFFGSQAIISLDDITYINNQSECVGVPSRTIDIRDVTYIDVILLGVTVRANDNRFTEGLTVTLFSLMALGLFVTVVYNQASNCILVKAGRALPQAANIPQFNVIIFNLKECENYLAKLKP
jgi:Family of unknown function (DUF6519)